MIHDVGLVCHGHADFLPTWDRIDVPFFFRSLKIYLKLLRAAGETNSYWI